MLRKETFSETAPHFPHKRGKKTASIEKNSSVEVSHEAADKLKEIMEKEKKTGWVLYFGDVAGHCGGGFGYELKLVPSAVEGQEVYESHGIKIAVPKESLKRLLSSKISYHDGPPNELFDDLLRDGFTIGNSREKGPCVCGCQKGHAF